MTEQYIKKLIILAEELWNYPGITTDNPLDAERPHAIFDAKLQFLLGYIMALKESQ